nr:MAG TPA: hypothetical protein [Caudoviricetes sp.]
MVWLAVIKFGSVNYNITSVCENLHSHTKLKRFH